MSRQSGICTPLISFSTQQYMPQRGTTNSGKIKPLRAQRITVSFLIAKGCTCFPQDYTSVYLSSLWFIIKIPNHEHAHHFDYCISNYLPDLHLLRPFQPLRQFLITEFNMNHSSFLIIRCSSGTV